MLVEVTHVGAGHTCWCRSHITGRNVPTMHQAGGGRWFRSTNPLPVSSTLSHREVHGGLLSQHQLPALTFEDDMSVGAPSPSVLVPLLPALSADRRPKLLLAPLLPVLALLLSRLVLLRLLGPEKELLLVVVLLLLGGTLSKSDRRSTISTCMPYCAPSRCNASASPLALYPAKR
jgi:hypothetical protein